MFNLYTIPTDVDYQEIDGCAEYAFKVIFAHWETKDFAELFASLKSYPNPEKYLEDEENGFRPMIRALNALPTKESKMQEKRLSPFHQLVLTYARWRWATAALLIQNRLLELKTVQTSSARKTVDYAFQFLTDVDVLCDFAPLWIEPLGDSSPFLNQTGEEVWTVDDLDLE
ncbi:hypothetical protein FW755_03335 [Lonepinella koalarum]|uniref:hypothetical protein n=1 Tax=Lonepinella koalarum TaxID=53417 RepID=UPI0011E45FD4|nr:hypothetical protein [Lonepinella koalarum]TYG34190.1 hypothetical protein FW755_03335 [Lonepinella koalarum]